MIGMAEGEGVVFPYLASLLGGAYAIGKIGVGALVAIH
jgi:hypothetical protein